MSLVSLLVLSLFLGDPAALMGPRIKPRVANVALTFDDGPDPANTPAILKILDDYHVRATFFVVGRNAKAHPELIRAIRNAGHVIANHSYSHPRLTRMSSAKASREIERTNQILYAITGEHPKCMRPPYGSVSKRVRSLARHDGVKTVIWDLSSFDYKRYSPKTEIDWVLSHSKPGYVILMHDIGRGGAQTIKALPSIIEGFEKRNIGFDTICD